MGAFFSSAPGPHSHSHSHSQSEDVSGHIQDVSSQDVSGHIQDVSSQDVSGHIQDVSGAPYDCSNDHYDVCGEVVKSQPRDLRRLLITEPARNNVSIFACCATSSVTAPTPAPVSTHTEVLLNVVEPRDPPVPVQDVETPDPVESIAPSPAPEPEQSKSESS